MRKLLGVLALSCMLLLSSPGASAAEQPEPSVRMYIQQEGRGTASADSQCPHKWLIYCRLPSETWEGGVTVFQTLSPYLTLVPDSLEVYCVDSGQALMMGVDYDLTCGSVPVDGGIADRICISLSDTGMQLLSAESQLRISYHAFFRDDAPMGTQIPGSAQLVCTGTEGERRSVLSNKASVSTGGVCIQLTDFSGKPVSGGKFMLAREADPEETVVPELLDTGESILPVVYVSFRDASGKERYVAETDLDGNAQFRGLAYGTYYLVHTELPEGRGLPSVPVKIRVNEVSHLRQRDGWLDSDGSLVDHTVRIRTGEVVMPKTGGPGAGIYHVSGCFALLLAMLLHLFGKKHSHLS